MHWCVRPGERQSKAQQVAECPNLQRCTKRSVLKLAMPSPVLAHCSQSQNPYCLGIRDALRRGFEELGAGLTPRLSSIHRTEFGSHHLRCARLLHALQKRGNWLNDSALTAPSQSILPVREGELPVNQSLPRSSKALSLCQKGPESCIRRAGMEVTRKASPHQAASSPAEWTYSPASTNVRNRFRSQSGELL